MTKAYSYLRFSNPEQSKGDSVRRQTEAAEAFALSHGLELDYSLRFEDRGVSGFSGANIRQGALGQFLRAVDDGLVESGSYLLVENLDRMSRANPWEAMPIFQQIINAGINIVTLQDQRIWSREVLRDQPYRIFESLLVMIRANEESATKSRRVSQAWAKKRELAASTSQPITKIAPAWLRVTEDRAGFEVIAERADLIRRIFQRRLDGHGCTAIAASLNREGVPPLGRAKFWHATYIQKIISNPAAIGTYSPHSHSRADGQQKRIPLEQIENYFPAIIPESVFSDVQALRAGSVHVTRAGTKRPIASIFAGLAECPICGSTMLRVAKGAKSGPPKFVCTKAKAGAGCQYVGVRVPEVEQALATNASWIAAHAPSGNEHIDEKLKSATTALQEVETRIAHLITAIASGASGPSIYAELRTLETEKDELGAEIKSLSATQLAETGRIVDRRIDDWQEALSLKPFEEWDSDDRALINACMRQVIKSVVLDYRSGVMVLNWKHGGSTDVLYALPSAQRSNVAP